jgi:hypothetical protein
MISQCCERVDEPRIFETSSDMSAMTAISLAASLPAAPMASHTIEHVALTIITEQKAMPPILSSAR